MTKVTRVTISAAMQSALTDRTTRYLTYYGGRGGGKTECIALAIVVRAAQSRIRVLCCRETCLSLRESSYAAIVKAINALGWAPHYAVSAGRLSIRCRITGSEIVFSGLSDAADGAGRAKSISDINLCWVEEAQDISRRSLDLLLPSIRGRDAQIIMSLNPREREGAVYQDFVANNPRNSRSFLVNYTDNPFFPPELEAERARAEATMPPARYRHIWLGEPTGEDDRALIQPQWIAACIDAHRNTWWRSWGDDCVVGYDVAGAGTDSNALIVRRGNVVVACREWLTETPTASAATVLDAAIDNAGVSKRSIVVYDANGVGMGMGALITEIDDGLRRKDGGYLRPVVSCEPYSAGSGPANPDGPSTGDYLSSCRTNRETFANRAAQSWWHVRELIYNTYLASKGMDYDPDRLISISSSIDSLERLELELAQAVTYTINGRQAVDKRGNRYGRKSRVERDHDSPDVGDAFVMAFAPW